MINEKKLERKLREEVKKLGGMALKFISPGHAGVYDRIVLMPGGKIWFVEMKSSGKKLSPLQEVFQKQMDKLIFSTREIDCVEKLESFLHELREQSYQKCS